MKTAGQDFLEWYNYYVKKYGCSPSDYDVNYFWNGGNLEKEKEQIMDAAEWKGELYPEDYYNATFGDSN
jgi:hypothetical protein